LDPIRENIGRSRGTNKGRSLDEFIRCRIIGLISLTLGYQQLKLSGNI